MGSSPLPRRPSAEPFALLYRAHLAFVWHIVRLAGIRDADIADVVQEVFILLDRAIRGGLDVSRPLRGWLKKTAFRCARDHRVLARNREQPGHEQPVEPADRGPNPEESMEVSDARVHVTAILDQLPSEHRMVLVMSDIEEMPMSEIAEVLEIPVGTGYSRLHAGRRTFERAWNERRASGLAAVAPFALWDAGSLLKTEQSIPDAPAGLSLTAKHLAAFALVSALAGAGLHAAVRAWLDADPPPVAASAHLAEDSVAGSASAAAPVLTAASAAPSVTVASATTTAVPCTRAAGNTEAAERASLDLARAMLDRRKPEGARAALARVRSRRFAAERDDLMGLVELYPKDAGAP